MGLDDILHRRYSSNGAGTITTYKVYYNQMDKKWILTSSKEGDLLKGGKNEVIPTARRMAKADTPSELFIYAMKGTEQNHHEYGFRRSD